MLTQVQNQKCEPYPFPNLVGAGPTLCGQHSSLLHTSWVDTPLGPMMIIADEKGVYLLEFIDKCGLECEIEQLRIKTKSVIISGKTLALESITQELHAYFLGTLTEFKTPLHLLGSPFQKRVWEKLLHIPYGVTRTYAAQAETMGKAKAYRAVANANGANQLTIVIPCHRIINSNGKLGGYAGGVARKQWLIDHEKNNV